MHRLLRLIVVWLLAATLPVQAIAAASMACSSLHPPRNAVAAGLQAEPRLEAVAAHHHPHAAAADESRGKPDHQAAHGKSGTAKCSLCAACCTSAALPSTSIVLDAVGLPRSFAALEPKISPAFMTGGQERPPRPFLA